MYFSASALLTAIIIYYDRVYLEDEDKARLSFRRNDLEPKEAAVVSIAHLPNFKKVCLKNKGAGPIRIVKADEQDINNLEVGIKLDCGESKTFYAEQFPLSGTKLFIVNDALDKMGKLRLGYISVCFF